MLSTTTEYALRIMVVLAESGGEPVTSERVATHADVPPDYSVKVLQMLARAGLVRAQRGRGGGFKFTCDPQTTTLLDVINAIEPLERIAKDRAAGDPSLDLLRRHLDDVLGVVRESLSEITLDRIIESKSSRFSAPSEMRPSAGASPATTRRPA